MSRALLLLFAACVLTFALASSVGLVALWRLRRHNRLHPAWPTSAPITWLVHPGAPARLHRRLRAAVRTAHHRPAGPRRHKVPHSAVDELVAELLHEAAALDEQVVLAGRAPLSVRRRIVTITRPQVAQLEALAGRLAVLVSATGRPGGVPAAAAIRTLEDKLDALEVSRQEIADLEAMLRVTPSTGGSREDA